MEGWQKGAPAVLKMSASAKQNYFKQFPDREAWFHSNYPEHFGRSAAAATSSLKKVTKAKVKKQRLAAIRQAAEKRDQLKVSSDAVRAMGQRRRESGEGLGGGLETNRDIVAHAAAGNYIKSGGLGSLYESDESSDSITKKGTKWVFRGQEYDSEKAARQAKEGYDQKVDADTRLADKVSNLVPTNFIDTALDKLKIGASTTGDVLNKMLNFVTQNNPMPSSTNKPSDPKWERLFKPESEGGAGNPNKAYMSDIDSAKKYIAQRQFRTPAEVDASVKARGIDPSVKLEPEELETAAKRKAQDAGYIEDKGMYEDTKEFAKQLAQRIMEQKRLQECMPMPMNSMGEGEKSESEDEPGEYDYEGDMAKSQLRSIAYNSKMLHDMLEDNTNLPEWVQSKITLAEDYIMTAANYMRGEMMNEEAKDVKAVHASMEKTMKKDMEEDLPFDPTGERKPGNVVDKSGAVHTPMSRVRHLAQMAAMRAEVSQQKPETAEDLVAQHQAMHTLEEKMNLETAKMGDVIKDFQKSDAPQFKGKSKEKRRQMAIAAKLSAERGSRMDEQMTLDQAKKDPRYMSDPAFKAEVDKAEAFAAGFDQSNDMVNPSMLPDTPTIPQGQGFGDDIEAKKKEKILNKTKVAVSKKKDNYDMVNREALPDMPPANMQEENEVVEQEVEEIEVPQEEVIQEPIQEQTPVSDNPYVAAAAGFLNNTSNRLLYGERK